MKYQVGDKVLILHSNEEGEIIEIINDKMVMVNVRGVNFPVYMVQIEFPYIKELVAYKKTGIHPTFRISISEGPLADMHKEHEAAGDMLKTIRNLTNNYQVPGGACASFQELYTRLEELEGDLHQHIHLENNILFPRALALSLTAG